MTTAVLTFDTTHYALLAEQVALDRGVAVQVIPAPPDAHARCDLALEYLVEDERRLLALLEDADVAFQRYPGPAAT